MPSASSTAKKRVVSGPAVVVNRWGPTRSFQAVRLCVVSCRLPSVGGRVTTCVWALLSTSRPCTHGPGVGSALTTTSFTKSGYVL